jgi:hypothetical protein
MAHQGMSRALINSNLLSFPVNTQPHGIAAMHKETTMKLLPLANRPSRPVLLSVLFACVLSLASAPAAQAQETKPALYMVSAGISKYTRMNPLQCAHKDALDMSALFATQKDKLFGDVDITTVIDGQATVRNILSGIAAVQKKATAESYVIVYLAGHGGKALHNEYNYCAFDTDLPWNKIESALRTMPGKVIVILDTCQAAAATGGRNLTVFCGCLETEGGMEDPDPNGNGHFTKTLIAGLKGRADKNGDGLISLEEAETYVATKLSNLSNGQQNSKVLRPEFAVTGLPLFQFAAVK